MEPPDLGPFRDKPPQRTKLFIYEMMYSFPNTLSIFFPGRQKKRNPQYFIFPPFFSNPQCAAEGSGDMMYPVWQTGGGVLEPATHTASPQYYRALLTLVNTLVRSPDYSPTHARHLYASLPRDNKARLPYPPSQLVISVQGLYIANIASCMGTPHTGWIYLWRKKRAPLLGPIVGTSCTEFQQEKARKTGVFLFFFLVPFTGLAAKCRDMRVLSLTKTGRDATACFFSR